MRRRNRWTAGLLLSSAVLLVLCRFAGDIPARLAKYLAAVLHAFSARIPFPIAELLAPICLLALVWKREYIGLFASALLCSYILLWVPLSAESAAPDMHVSGDLESLCARLIGEANAEREELPERDGRLLPPYDDGTLCEKAGKLMRTPPPKMARYPEWMEAFGVAGIYIPWTGEALVNGLEPDASLPFTACHELAHALGRLSEAEANYAAYEACSRGDGYFRYAGALSALYYAMEALHDADYVAWVDLRFDMTEAVQRDFYAMNGFHDARPSQWSMFHNRVADAYLRLSGQNGLSSYGAFIDRLISP